MITLYQYPPIWGLSSLSPFCIKTELFLKYHRIPYKNEIINNPLKGPRGKLPFIVYGKQKIPDSNEIISFLQSQFTLPESNSQDLVYQSLLENEFYFILLYSRWCDDSGYVQIKKAFSQFFPYLLSNFCMSLIRRNLLKQAFHQGIGRIPTTIINSRGIEILKSLEEFLEKRDITDLSSFDFSCYATISTIIKSPIDTDIYDYTRQSKIFENYIIGVESEIKKGRR